MKYWNKDKAVRVRCWTRVKLNTGIPRYPYAMLKRDLQLDPSTGKFYMYYAGDNIWFEDEKDAVMFALKWL